MSRTRRGRERLLRIAAHPPALDQRAHLQANVFFSSLKKERIKKHIYKNRELALADVAQYIDRFYNRTRRHSYLGGVSPEQFEAVQRPRRRSVH
jgi:transposase InsO family protein